ncbi:E3 ubiquitin-protein ligase TRIM39-like [Tachysurus vachellii]|uniref:E3 ubiquitin-protein ligase TRIM39-like n=1 Tax=Tachysurus vachellii TaxID=175792 RepID=UPI00296B4645|nr:E3 ubiquitin-protein ligase TRIM39-like [Tachysurus vachellii]
MIAGDSIIRNIGSKATLSHDSSSLLSEDLLLCSICVDVLTDPVTTPCGHNLCNSCLTLCWDMNQHCHCPLCNQKFTKRPELKINTTLREIADYFKKKSEPHYHVQDRLKKIIEIKHSAEQSKRSTEKEKADIVEVFTALIRSIERSQAELQEMMEEKQKAAERKAEGLIKELEISVLKRRDTELEQLSHTEEHLHLLQIYSSMCSPPHTKNWTEISINTDVNMYTVTTALSQLQQTLNEKLTKSLTDKLKETELMRIQQYAVDVTLDPDTAHPDLILSADGKQVTHGDKRQNLPDTPQRFDWCICVLGKQSFSSGRFYYEVQVRGETGWSLGVARENINRKGEITLSPQDGFWTVILRNENQYKACAGPSVPLTLREKVEVVGVFVDYEKGLVSFYDVKSRSHIYSFTGQTFTEKLYPFFNLCLNEGGKNSAPLIIYPVFNTE